MQLLANVAGRDRVLAAAPEASGCISTACDKLPLAQRIARARLNTRPGVAVTMLAEGLEDERGRVEELAFGDMSMHPRLWPSYRALDPVACSAFRTLGSSGASLFTDATAEQLPGLRRTAIDPVMEDLVRHNLLTSVAAPVLHRCPALRAGQEQLEVSYAFFRG